MDGGQTHRTWNTFQHISFRWGSVAAVEAKNVEDDEDALKLPKFWTDFDLETCRNGDKSFTQQIESVKEIQQQ